MLTNNVSLKWIVVFMMITGLISTAQASDFTQLQWTDGVSGTLHRGDSITYKNYSVTVVSLPPPVESDKYKPIPSEPVEPFVGLNISKDGIYLNTTVLMLGGSFIVPDGELQITVKQLPLKNATVWLFESYAPWATIELSPRGIPTLDVTISADSQYISSSTTDIIVTLTIKNTGSADLFNVDVDVITKLQVKRGDLDYHFERVRRTESITKTMTFSAPIITEKRSFEISANLTGHDAKDIRYRARGTKTINVVPEPLNIPTLKKTTNSKVYLKDNSMISLTFKNNAKYELRNVSIRDSVPKNFKLVGNNTLNWTTNLSAYEEWNIHYLIKPDEPAESIDLPAASAEFKLNNEYYKIQSNRPKIVVYGPMIVLTKQTDAAEIRSGDNVTVTVTGRNKGSTPTRVEIKDQLPPGTHVVSGTTTKEEYVEADKNISLSYVIKIESKNPVKLPPATAEYYELGTKGTKRNTSSSDILIRIKPDVTPTPVIEIPPASSSSSDNVNESPAASEIVELPVITPIYETPAGPYIEEIISNASTDIIEEVMNMILGIKPLVMQAPVSKIPPAATSEIKKEPETPLKKVDVPVIDLPAVYETPAKPQKKEIRSNISTDTIDSLTSSLLGCETHNLSAFSTSACNFVRNVSRK